MNTASNKRKQAIMAASAEFLTRVSGRQSLITVTDADVSPDGRNATIYISVLPGSANKQALEFCNRQLSDLREHVGERVRLRTLPHFEVALDPNIQL
ncbi:MAG: ribosome-binding factor A [Candidatus Vogelbacteria bacterium]|nr:ribosome-binding factor A [Candidatus Vogelbacteria bacterium]